MRAVFLLGILTCFSYAAPVPMHREPSPISADELVGTWEIKHGSQHWVYEFKKDGSCRCMPGDATNSVRYHGEWRWRDGKLETIECINTDIAYRNQFSVKLIRGKAKGTLEGSENQWVAGLWRRVQ